MAVTLNPYLSFRDNAREAMEFYHSVFGGTVSVDTFGQTMPDVPAAEADKVMHAQLESKAGFVLMASDTPAGMPYQPGSAVSIALTGDEDETLRGYWEALVEGGSVDEPLTTAPWGDSFGMCTDRFGTRWMVNISAMAA